MLVTIGGFNDHLKLGEDLDLMLRIAMVRGRFREASSCDALFFYRQTPESLWQRAETQVEVISDLVGVFRRAETFLREQAVDGLSEAARHALARRYSNWLNRLLEDDRKTFRDTLHRIRELGFTFPPGTTRKWQLISHLIGFEKAQALRLSYRRIKRR